MSTDSARAKELARAKAAAHFTQTLREDERRRQELEKERQARAAKNERLRALRLAKEAADRTTAKEAAAAKPGRRSDGRG